MLGTKINEFDNTLGTLDIFRSLFPESILDGDDDTQVEILGIHEPPNRFGSNPFIRDVLVGDTVIVVDFSVNNFNNNKDFQQPDKVRFKYYATNLRGRVVATSYNCLDLAKKLKCSDELIRKRLVEKITRNTNYTFPYNITRREI